MRDRDLGGLTKHRSGSLGSLPKSRTLPAWTVVGHPRPRFFKGGGGGVARMNGLGRFHPPNQKGQAMSLKKNELYRGFNIYTEEIRGGIWGISVVEIPSERRISSVALPRGVCRESINPRRLHWRRQGRILIGSRRTEETEPAREQHSQASRRRPDSWETLGNMRVRKGLKSPATA